MSERNRYKYKLWIVVTLILSILLISSNLFWFYGIVDQASIQKYSDIMLNEKTNTLIKFEKFPHIQIGMSKSEVLHKIKEIDSTSISFEKEGKLHIDYLSFTFDDSDQLVKIEEMNQY